MELHAADGDSRFQAIACETLLLAQTLQPLAHEFDVLGGYGTELLARSIAEHDANGFGKLLAERFSHGGR